MRSGCDDDREMRVQAVRAHHERHRQRGAIGIVCQMAIQKIARVACVIGDVQLGVSSSRGPSRTFTWMCGARPGYAAGRIVRKRKPPSASTVLLPNP